MKHIWKNHKLKIVVLIYVLIVALASRFFVLPWINKIMDKANSIQEKIVNNQVNESRLGNIGDMESAYNKFQEKKEVMNVILDPSDEVNFIKKLESLAQDTGNEIALKISETDNSKTSTSQKNATKKTDEKSIKDSLAYPNFFSVEVDLKGNYLNLVSFLKKLENMHNYANVISIQSKKETLVTIEENQASKPSEVGVFSTISPNPNPAPAQPTRQKEKDILNSVINLIVYTKK